MENIELHLPKIKKENLQKIIEASINPVPYDQILRSIKTDPMARPVGFSIDKRNGNLIFYCPSRRKRPKNNKGTLPCSVCQGELPPVFLAKSLQRNEYAFVTENRFSFLNPDRTIDNFFQEPFDLGGINLLLWPSTEHKEIHYISYEDHAISFEIMAEMEDFIRNEAGCPFVQIVKNMSCTKYLRPMHGQYHLAGIRIEKNDDHENEEEFFWKKPKNAHEDTKYIRKKGESYPMMVQDLYTTSYPGFVIKDYGEAFLAIHPNMRRPLEAIIYPKDPEIETLTDMNKDQKFAFAKATSDASYALSLLMPAMGITQEYCFVYHNNGGTFYIEVFPNTQQAGGFERQRVYVCESCHGHSLEIYRGFFNDYISDTFENRIMINPKDIKKIKEKIIKKIDDKYARFE